MILRRVDHLGSGMKVRINVFEHKRAIVRQIDRVDYCPQDREKRAVRFFKDRQDSLAYEFYFWADDLLEIVSL